MPLYEDIIGELEKRHIAVRQPRAGRNYHGEYTLFPIKTRPYQSRWLLKYDKDTLKIVFSVESTFDANVAYDPEHEYQRRDLIFFLNKLRENNNATQEILATLPKGQIEYGNRSYINWDEFIPTIELEGEINTDFEFTHSKEFALSDYDDKDPKGEKSQNFIKEVVRCMLELLPLFKLSVANEEVRNKIPGKVLIGGEEPPIPERTKMKNKETSTIMLADYYSKFGYLFDPDLVSAFYNALRTKGFVILSGLSGTGKTKIAQLFIELLYGGEADKYKCFIPVRPDFRDSKYLFGYFNPLKGEYQTTELLELIINASDEFEKEQEKAHPYFVILDEMNLAHVEHYFAEFLSTIESGKDFNDKYLKDSARADNPSRYFSKEGIPLHNLNDEEIKSVTEAKKREEIIVNFPPRILRIPPNLYIIGTVNVDETTSQFSPKVLDRAFSIEFNEVDLDNYPINVDDEPIIEKEFRDKLMEDFTFCGIFLRKYTDKHAIKSAYDELDRAQIDTLKKINKILEIYDLHFGYRTMDEIILFISNASYQEETGSLSSLDSESALDLAILMKILPKLHGNRQKLEKPLKEIYITLEGGGLPEDYRKIIKDKTDLKYKHTSKKILRMLADLREKGFASYC